MMGCGDESNHRKPQWQGTKRGPEKQLFHAQERLCKGDSFVMEHPWSYSFAFEGGVLAGGGVFSVEVFGGEDPGFFSSGFCAAGVDFSPLFA